MYIYMDVKRGDIMATIWINCTLLYMEKGNSPRLENTI